MTFFKLLKCAFCPRWSCHARYKIGNRSYYSYLGFVRTECPKKLDKDPFVRCTRRLNEELTRQRMEQIEKDNLNNK